MGRAETFRVTGLLLLAVALSFVVLEPIRADNLPSHGAVTHLDPFIPGWPLPPAFPPPGPGVVMPGDGLLADPEYDVLGPISTDVKNGFDGLVAPNNFWHWEMEFDLDPYITGGVVPILFDFRAFGGGTRLVNLPLIPGPDIYMDIHQPDQGAAGETGPFFKFFANLTTTFTPAWGVSVTEDPEPPLSLLIPGKEIIIVGDPTQNFSVVENTSGNNGFQLLMEDNRLVLRQVPEPTALSLSAAAVMLALAVRRRRR